MDGTLWVRAGGESRRMGRSKPWIEVGNTVLLRYVLERLAPAFSEVIVSFSEPEQMEQHVPYRVVFDRKQNAGPLAGPQAAPMGGQHPRPFAAACPNPHPTPSSAAKTPP